MSNYRTPKSLDSFRDKTLKGTPYSVTDHGTYEPCDRDRYGLEYWDGSHFDEVETANSVAGIKKLYEARIADETQFR